MRPNRFGLTFAALGLAAGIAWRQHRRGRGAAIAAPLLWLSLGCAAIVLAFLLSPETDVEHHLRSSASRLLSHWVGVAWLVVGAVWAGARVADQPSSN